MRVNGIERRADLVNDLRHHLTLAVESVHGCPRSRDGVEVLGFYAVNIGSASLLVQEGSQPHDVVAGELERDELVSRVLGGHRPSPPSQRRLLTYTQAARKTHMVRAASAGAMVAATSAPMVRPRPASVCVVFIVTGFLFVVVVGGGEGVDAGVLDDSSGARVGAGAGGVADLPDGGVQPFDVFERHWRASSSWSASSLSFMSRMAFMVSSGWLATMRPARARSRMHWGMRAHARRWWRPWRPPKPLTRWSISGWYLAGTDISSIGVLLVFVDEVHEGGDLVCEGENRGGGAGAGLVVEVCLVEDAHRDGGALVLSEECASDERFLALGERNIVDLHESVSFPVSCVVSRMVAAVRGLSFRGVVTQPRGPPRLRG
nr:MAG TPA: hypothetical protein [Caudoviricetes sp.]